MYETGNENLRMQNPAESEWGAIIRNAECIAAANYTRCGGGVQRDDVRQDLLLAVVEAMPDYKPELATRTTFADRIMRRRVNNIVRSSNADRIRRKQ